MGSTKDIHEFAIKPKTGKHIITVVDEFGNEAKRNFEKSLELNPNDAYANQMIAIYYSFGAHKDLEKRLFYIDRAIKLDTFSAIISEAKIHILLQGEKIKEAEEFFTDKKLLFSDYNKEYLNNRIVLFKIDKYAEEKKDWTQAMTYCEKEIEKEERRKMTLNTHKLNFRRTQQKVVIVVILFKRKRSSNKRPSEYNNCPAEIGCKKLRQT